MTDRNRGRPPGRQDPSDASTLPSSWTHSSTQPDRGSPELPREILDGKRLGKYRIVREISSGGMGTVYLAHQETPVERQVAIKVIKEGLDSKQVLARFQAERQALAFLNHPHIAHIYDADATPIGRPYFVMEYVPGDPITQYCDDKRLTIPARLALFMEVADAIHYAHQRGIIHRDLTPSNVLISTEAEPATPKIIDFGLAKIIDHQGIQRSVFTERGAIVGTPEFMSPEQASDSASVDARTDVYSLGLILYALLVGVLPFDSTRRREAGLLELLRQIREAPTPRPSLRLSTLGPMVQEIAQRRQTDWRTLRRHLKTDLDWICIRALEADRRLRYSSAADLRAEISRCLERRSPLAAPPHVGYRVRRALVCKRPASVIAGSVVLGMMAAIFISMQFIFRDMEAESLPLSVALALSLLALIHFVPAVGLILGARWGRLASGALLTAWAVLTLWIYSDVQNRGMVSATELILIGIPLGFLSYRLLYGDAAKRFTSTG